jgi:5-methylcytosine-specific restriction endonuclease McrA
MALNTRKNPTKHGTRNNYKGVCIRKDLRLAIYLRDDFRCIYCLADLRDADPFDISLDHITPASDGGTNLPSNMVTACRSCNCSRGDKPLARFCGPETRKHIARNTRRAIGKYRVMAKALIAGETGGEYEVK